MMRDLSMRGHRGLVTMVLILLTSKTGRNEVHKTFFFVGIKEGGDGVVTRRQLRDWPSNHRHANVPALIVST